MIRKTLLPTLAPFFGQAPPGVTVFVTTTVPATDVNETTTVNFPSHGSISQTRDYARQAFGPGITIEHLYSAYDGVVNKKSNVDAVFVKLTKLARVRAQIIAGADGQHIGRLINASPSFASMLRSLIPTGGIFGSSAIRPTNLTESGTFTFELSPGA